MSLTIIHIVSSLQQINYGVFNAVISTFEYLKNSNVKSVLAFPASEKDAEVMGVALVPLDAKEPIVSIEMSGYLGNANNTVIVTHGNWKLPTQLGAHFKTKGYTWVVVPHGMMEPWGMRNRWYVKWPYYLLFEKNKLKKADCIVGVSSVETKNLRSTFKNVVHIANGITPTVEQVQKPEERITFLFLSRLHNKKGVVPLTKAWVQSSLNNDSRYKLILAGPDEGEGEKLKELNKRSNNILLAGAQYGEAKTDLLNQAHFFLLPSYSEGFPTAVLEAITYGCIPMISKGCNFPEAFDANVAIEVSPNATQLTTALERVAQWSFSEMSKMGSKAKEFVDGSYALEIIAKQQLELYQKLVNQHE